MRPSSRSRAGAPGALGSCIDEVSLRIARSSLAGHTAESAIAFAEDSSGFRDGPFHFGDESLLLVADAHASEAQKPAFLGGVRGLLGHADQHRAIRVGLGRRTLARYERNRRTRAFEHGILEILHLL